MRERHGSRVAGGVSIPSWVVQIGWIVLVALVAIFAIKLLIGWI